MIKSLTLVLCMMAVFTSTVAANIVSFDMSVVWNGATPALLSPWLNATFDDEGTEGSVVLTITAGNLSGTQEKVKELHLNLDPTLNPLDLDFSAPTLISGEFDDPSADTGLNAFKADGDGKYHILIEFGTADGGTDSFGAGDAVEFTINGIASLTASSFNFICLPKKVGEGEYFSVAHILGIEDIGEGGSGWITIPEPASIAPLAIGALALLRKRRA
ncbi:MAG: PEP-CTERM sorting domain-containing protein [Sedimentisphaerales bacterium]|nr:PEP-CTERM sorting domain-containing protein [Sedimentisphaerales bacterium]